MRVGELIEKLQQFDPSTPVGVVRGVAFAPAAYILPRSMSEKYPGHVDTVTRDDADMVVTFSFLSSSEVAFQQRNP